MTPGITSHRFSVQAMEINDGEVVTKDDWANADPSEIADKRLSVVFHGAEEEQNENGDDKAGPSSRTKDSGDLKVKYDELVAYTVNLEREKHRLECQLES